MRCSCGYEFTWEDFIDKTERSIIFHCPKCEYYISTNLKSGQRSWATSAPTSTSKKNFRSIEEEVWSFVKGCKISWKGLLAERLGRNYLQVNGYKISRCHCHFLLHDVEDWSYVHEKLDPNDETIGYWTSKGIDRSATNGDLFPWGTGINYTLDDIAIKGDNVYAVEYKSSKSKPTWYKPNEQKKRFMRLKKFGFKLLVVNVPINVDYMFNEKKLDLSFNIGEIKTILI